MTFIPPPYPYERLGALSEVASLHEGGAIDCSIGTPVDDPPAEVLEVLARAVGVRGYPPSAGTAELRDAAGDWLRRRFRVEVPSESLAACVGTKEFVASLAGFLHRRDPSRDVVLYPEISYPTYAMSATLAGLEPRAVPERDGRLDLAAIPAEVAARALVLWVNSPSNPTGDLDDLDAAAAWGRAHDVLVVSDECYADYTWRGDPRTILEGGLDGVLALHSTSKRSNLAGLRVGFYAGDSQIVAYLRLVRQHAGLMVPGPAQAAAAAAYRDDDHVAVQRRRYHDRLDLLATALREYGVAAEVPAGGFYLWCRDERADGWALAGDLARDAGLVVSPGELYGTAGSAHVRIAVVQPTERLRVVAQRLRQRAASRVR